MIQILFLTICCVLGDSPQDAANQAVEDIVRAGQKKIGVIPVVINRRGDNEATIGRLGPRGKIMANELYTTMVSASQNGPFRGKFQVIPERVMRAALASRSVSDLANPRALEILASEVGNADGFVVSTVDQSTSKLDVTSLATQNSAGGKSGPLFLDGNVEVIKPSDSSVTSTVAFKDNLTLTKAAYQGESWEIRKWNGETIENVGINIDGPAAFLTSIADEESQLAKLKPNLPHPLSDNSFSYPIAVRVGKTVREPAIVGGRAVVELNAGEEYSILLQNKSAKGVYVALYIDGVNSINQQLISPENLETKNHWFLESNSGLRGIGGWFTISAESKASGAAQQFKTFKVVDREESVAAAQGFQDSIGMITALFYTVGMEGVPQSRSFGHAALGTGEGDQGSAKLEFANSQPSRGILLASTTLYYRTGDQLQNIQSGTSNDILAEKKDSEDGIEIKFD